MSCMEVWGGSQLTDRGVEFGGLDAWVYSKPYGEAQRGGDVYYASSCATGRITRVLLADVAGHGTAVAATAADLRLLMRRYVNCLDQTECVRSINRQFAELSRQSVFATAVMTTFFAPTGRLTVCNAGHPRPLIYRASERQWDFLDAETGAAAGPRNLPLGILSLSDYDQFDVELNVGDCVVSYTDALIESQDADGEMLGEDGVLRIVRLLGEVSGTRVLATLLGEIRDRYPKNLSNDDVTVVVMEVTGRKLRFSARQQLRALGRMCASLLRAAINPRAERPPLPDARLANIGGAIFPVLGRRWRAPAR